MTRQLKYLFIFALIGAWLAGCSWLPELKEETTGWSAERFYKEAHDAQVDGNYTRAIKLFEQLEARYPYGRYAQQAIIEGAYANYKSNEPAAALAGCERFIKLYPNHPYIDYVYYLKGLINFNEDLGLLGSLGGQDMAERDPKAAREAYETFQLLSTKFPESKYAADAHARAVFLINALADHEAIVARYYFERGAYVAAVNRAQTVLTTYPNAGATEKALVIMIRSYDKLGLVQLRDDTKRILEKTFPNDRSALAGTGKSWWKFWQ
jgi:outer membrane protein assembly factor BamD